MRVIKRYPNRKLYDTEAKAYINLNGIAALIRQGEEVQIVDHATGDDLTALTLTQVILEQEKKQGGYLPRSVLTGLIRTGGDTLSNLRRTLGSVDVLRQVDEEIDRRLQSLLKGGELAEEEVRRLRDKLLRAEFPLSRKPKASDEELLQALAERGVPTRNEFERLSQQVGALLEKLDDLGGTED